MSKLMKGYKRVRRETRAMGEPFNRRPTNVMFKRRQRSNMAFDKRRRLWVKKGSR